MRPLFKRTLTGWAQRRRKFVAACVACRHRLPASPRWPISSLHQPVVSLSAGRIAAVEALVRWEHPGHGLMPPDEFIPIAAGVETSEQRDVVKALGCHQARGFFFSRPVVAEEIGLLLDTRAPLAGKTA